MSKQLDRKPSVIISLPSDHLAIEETTPEQLKNYFGRYPGGIVGFFEEAVRFKQGGGLTQYMDWAVSIFEKSYEPLIDVNVLTRKQYDIDYRNFRRMVMEVWRYVTATFNNLGECSEFRTIKVIDRDVFTGNLTMLLE